MKIIEKKLCTFLLILLIPCSSVANTLIFNDAQSLRFREKIDSVFVSKSEILDYQVINEHNIVLLGKSFGEARIIVYGDNGNIISNRKYSVTLDTKKLNEKISKITQGSSVVRIEQIDDAIVLSGIVDDQETKERVFEFVGKYLKLDKVERFYEKNDDSSDSSEDDIVAKNISVDDVESTDFRLYEYEGLIDQVKVKGKQQINVKVVIAEINKELVDSMGFEWSTVGNSSGEFLFNTIEASELSALVYAMSTENIGQILAEPNLTVTSGERASFLVGGETPLISSSLSGTDISFKEFGIGLAMVAKVKSENNIRLKLAPSVTKIDSLIEAGDLLVPQLSSRKVTTSIELKDGQSFMVGGLLNSESSESKSKIPVLGDIPLIGGLFSGTNTRNANREVVIIATVNLVEPADSKRLQLPKYQKKSSLERLFDTSYDDIESIDAKGFY